MSVLVVGAGPVGLMLAAELHRHGSPCRVIERRANAAPYCKALGITPRTLEVWDDLGVVQHALAAGLRLLGLVSVANGDIANGTVEGSALAYGAYGFVTLAQYDVERILGEHLVRLGGRVERGVELVKLEQTADAVRAGLRRADGGTETVECRYLVGCDGGRSTVRHALQLPFEGEHFEQTFMLADVELNWDLPRGYGYKFARIEGEQTLGLGAVIPVPGNPRRYRFSTVAPEAMVPANLDAAADPLQGLSERGPTLEQVQEVLSWLLAGGTAAAVRASELRWSSFYRISHRLVTKYRVGRTLLAGDAAHLHPPLGGQGLNTGVQDAYNLAWKLALEVTGRAAAGLLDSYEAERRAVGLELVDRTTGRLKRVLAGDVGEQEPVRDDSQLFVNYRTSPIVVPSPFATELRAGDRAPDALGLRRPHVRHDERLFDLLRGPRHTFVLYTNHSQPEVDCRRFLDRVGPVASALAGQVVAIVHPDCPLPWVEGQPTLADSRNDFARLYGGRRGNVEVIRPDGYIGCRTTLANPGAVEAYARMVIRPAAGS